MGVLNWLGDQARRIGRTPSEIIGFVHRAVSGVWHILTMLGVNVRRAWGTMLTGVKDATYWLEHLAGSTYGKLRELFVVTIPRAIAYVLREAWRRASSAIGDVERWAKGALDTLRRYAVRIVNDLRGWAQSAVRWLTSHIADLASRATRLERRVFSLLDRPEHIVAWLFGALITHAFKFLRRYEVALARWLVRSAVGLIMRSLHEIETVIADIF